jgi:hypothetical protein
MRKGNLADGMGGKEPENMFTKEISNKPKKRKCSECGSYHLLKDLSDPKCICRWCRGLGDRISPKEKKRNERAEKKKKRKLIDEEIQHNFLETGFKETNWKRRIRERNDEEIQHNFLETGFKETNRERQSRVMKRNFKKFGFSATDDKISNLTQSGFFEVINSPQITSNETILSNLLSFAHYMGDSEKSMELIFNAFTVISKRDEIPENTRSRIIRMALIHCRRKKLNNWIIYFEELRDNL